MFGKLTDVICEHGRYLKEIEVTDPVTELTFKRWTTISYKDWTKANPGRKPLHTGSLEVCCQHGSATVCTVDYEVWRWQGWPHAFQMSTQELAYWPRIVHHSCLPRISGGSSE